MAKVKNETGQHLQVPSLGRMVMAKQVVEVDDAQVYGLTMQGVWSPADKAAEAAHKAGEKAHADAVRAEQNARHGVVDLAPQSPVADVDGDTESE